MSDCNTITKVLLRGGTDQDSRFNSVLDPNQLELHGFGIEEWMKFAYNFAGHVHYFDTSDHIIPQGDWTDFFKQDDEIESFLAELGDSDKLTPHLTLFICFLKLLTLTSDRFNGTETLDGITKRHLDFYYKEVLKIEKMPAQVDKVHILFELSKNVLQEKLEAGTLLNGGRDGLGKIRNYGLSEEFVPNKASIEALRNVYFAHDTTNSFDTVTPRQYIKASEMANSVDGIGDPLPEDNPVWYPFGYHHEEVDSDVFKELPDANIGFAISSQVLNLSEGNRHIQFNFAFSNELGLTDITTNDLTNSIKVYYTGEKKWLGPINLVSSVTLDDVDGSNNTSTFETTTAIVSGPPSKNYVKLYTKLGTSEKPTGIYNSEIHLGSYQTEQPVFKFIIDTSTVNGLKVYEYFSTTLDSIEIDTHVTDMRTLTLENDHGTLNPEKPMYPFTTLPVEGSSFTVAHEELIGKSWNKAGVKVKWKNQPSDFPEWYEAYKEDFKINLSKDKVSSNLFGFSIKDETSNENVSNISKDESDVIVKYDSYFKGNLLLKTNNIWNQVPGSSNIQLFNDLVVTGQDTVKNDGFIFAIEATNSYGDLEALRISLNNSFLHEMYPRLYALSLTGEGSITVNVAVEDSEATATTEGSSSGTVIPNVPYTPFTEDVSLSYTASDSINLQDTNESAYSDATVQLYHVHPFGLAQEHRFLKSQFSFGDPLTKLAPKYSRGGELYIGLKDADHLQNVSLLVQVLEGSENPDTSSFTGDEKVSWDILCDNIWKPLDSTLLTQNGIDNFLQSGIVTFRIPKEATSDNTMLGTGLFWVRAQLSKPFDAVCKILGVHAQATLAEFIDNENDLSHLEKGLEAETIGKLILRSSKVKGVLQPYNSFDGEAEEDDLAYYRRVSERLRHKKRAVTLWDYEHIVLQKFPDIYKVKCLNHSNCKSYVAPGNVVLIVIPDTVNKNVFDIYQPQASTARRNQIKDYIDQFNSLHVGVKVENPDYEQVQVDLSVQFHEGYDVALYIQELNNDIIQFLSPWAFDNDTNVEFGVTLHKSVLINFIEELPYVDYLANVKMKLKTGEDTYTIIEQYEPSSPKSILVSDSEHRIKADIEPCPTSAENIEQECQQ